MNIYDHKRKWQRRENESPNGAAYYGGGLFSEATCDPIVRLSHASPHQTRSQLKRSSPACQGAKTKYINSGKTNIICHTHLATETTFLPRRRSRCFGLFLRATPSKLFSLSRKKKEKMFRLSVWQDFVSRASPSFLCLHFCFPLFTSCFSPSDPLAATPRCGDGGIHQPVSPRGDSTLDSQLAPRLQRSPTNTGE